MDGRKLFLINQFNKNKFREVFVGMTSPAVHGTLGRKIQKLEMFNLYFLITVYAFWC